MKVAFAETRCLELRNSKDDSLGLKALEKKRDFLVYVTQTYLSMVWYPNGTRVKAVKLLQDDLMALEYG